ncbi:MAG: hypothetical protein GVY30_05910 [Chloroflexi bacterium]|jgi:cytidylate kinase|nr:hypothetical protein [Chloroflexota bacterium]
MSTIITVSRQLGSRGSYIATAVAKTLNLRYLDREILQRAAELAGYPDEAMVVQLEKREKVPSVLERVIEAMGRMPMIPTIASATLREGYTYDEQIAMMMLEDQMSRQEAYRRLVEEEIRAEASEPYTELLRQVIREYADIGDVMIVGRGGQVILQENPHVLHIRVQAPLEARIRYLMERMGIDREEAEDQIHQSDKDRARYLRHFHGVDWDDPTLYHVVINTGKITVDTATHLISEAARRISPPITG